MAAGKNPYLRYRIINACLTSKRKKHWSPDELIAKLGEHDLQISLRSLKSDLENMRCDERLGYFAPIVYCRTNKGYYYTDPDYSIDALPLSEEDIQAFSVLVNSLQKYKGALVVNQLEGMFDKLGKVAEQLKQKDKPQHGIIEFEKVPYYKGIMYFDPIMHALHNKQPIKITYKKFDHDNPYTHIFHPYLLKEYKSRWYTRGYSELRKTNVTLALDRIEEIVEHPAPFKENKEDNIYACFRHTIGVTIVKGDVEEVELLFTPSQGNYVKTLHLHDTQTTIADNDEGLRVTLALKPNYELLQTLLSYGAEVKVLKPLSLQEKIKEALGKACALYE
ncbi:WYL domain-containing protein [Chryseolinea sp. H1M3-3]|uniref:helix-turn-helix transcriptional regulator n=1 Tax=Chryseolinea sp. H1M3-3 TaxID=3034144 RepID=UPI0023EDACB8|nr:WYL domain-containing protein [Chryseolinea sp. H1M3-3]